MKSVITPLEIACPQCGRKFLAEYPMYVDAESDPEIKQGVITEEFRITRCPHCGSEVEMDLPFVYHDKDKELLIYYIPEVLLPQREEVNRFLGKINRSIMDSLPPSQRKGYLLRPKEVFSWNGLRKEIFLADGMSEEEVEEWEKSTRFLGELLEYEGEESGIKEMIEKHRDWFTLRFMKFFEPLLLSAVEALGAIEGNDARLSRLQTAYQWIMESTEIGKVLKEKDRAFDAILSSDDPAEMAEAIDGVPLEFADALADVLFSKFPEEDFEEFTMALARRIVKEKDPAKAEFLRKKKDIIVKAFNKLDKEAKKDIEKGMALLDEIMKAPDIKRAVAEHADEIDDRFIAAWFQVANQAVISSNEEAYRKLVQIRKAYHELLEEAMPPHIFLLYNLGSARYPDEVQRLLENNKDKMTPEFFQGLRAMEERAQSEEEKKFWGNVYAMAALMG